MQQTSTSTSTIQFKGASGTSWTFKIYSKSTKWNPVPCVYVVTKDTSSGHTVLYVGETEDMADRFSGHHKESCFKRNGWTNVCTYREPSQTKRRQIEADLLKNRNPVCNG
jgi:predicted GIY-YIG superfamily endonuclease